MERSVIARFRGLYGLYAKLIVEARDEAAIWCHRTVKRMHDERGSITHNGRCFVEKGVYLTGLKRVMSLMLHGNEESASHIERGGSASVRSDECMGSGRDHGSRVHRDVESIIECLVHSREPNGVYDPCALLAVEGCLAEGWIPMLTEHAISAPEIMVGTAIDLIAVDVARRRIVLIELKTGYSTEQYEVPRGKFGAPAFASADATPYAQHAMQIILCRAMLDRKIGDGMIDHRVVRICAREKRFYVHFPPAWSEDITKRADLYALFAAAARRRRPGKKVAA